MKHTPVSSKQRAVRFRRALFPRGILPAPVRAASRALLSAALCAALLSCGGNGETEIRAVTYNAQTFFDSVTSGSEFRDFRKEPWNDELYRARLKRLAEALSIAGTLPPENALTERGQPERIPQEPAASGAAARQKRGGFWDTFSSLFSGGHELPDVVVLQEIENAEVLADILAFLPVRDFYSDIVFAPPEKGGAFSTAVLSAFPVKRLALHGTAYLQDGKNSGSGKSATAASSKPPLLRPLVEVVLQTRAGNLAVFAVHWKSKAGAQTGDGNSGVRRMQEETLFRRLEALRRENPELPFLVCGDFNQQPDEFERMGQFVSAWDYLPEDAGTYFFRGQWEKIDNFFVSAHFEAGLESGESRFFTPHTPPLVNTDGEPAAFRLHTQTGYSDHLPLVFAFTLRGNRPPPEKRAQSATRAPSAAHTGHPMEASRRAPFPNKTASSLSSGSFSSISRSSSRL